MARITDVYRNVSGNEYVDDANEECNADVPSVERVVNKDVLGSETQSASRKGESDELLSM